MPKSGCVLVILPTHPSVQDYLIKSPFTRNYHGQRLSPKVTETTIIYVEWSEAVEDKRGMIIVCEEHAGSGGPINKIPILVHTAQRSFIHSFTHTGQGAGIY